MAAGRPALYTPTIMEAPAPAVRADKPFQQPRPLLRWLAVVLAAGGWFVSGELLKVSGGEIKGAFLDAVCGKATPGGRPADCAEVLTSPQAYVRIGAGAGAANVPVSAFGMAYFAFVALWYLFVGPPTYRGRVWHIPFALVVLYAAVQSVDFARVMHFELHRWCGGCLVAHGLNAGLVVLTVLAWPWRRPADTPPAHPTPRLTLATGALGVLLLVAHLFYAYLHVAGTLYREQSKRLEAIVTDPAYILWDYARQAVVEIPLGEDEPLAGNPNAAHTVVVFGDFQCRHCKDLHERLMSVAQKYADRLRVAFRACPQDPECNPNPRFRSGGHASACRAARAAEAAFRVVGRDAFLAMRKKLWEHQADLPDVPFARQSAAQRRCFEDWAAELGLDRAAFAEALDSEPVTERIRADIELAQRLGLQAMPAVFLDGKRLNGWSRAETWDALLGAE